jgi:hypothetical protein
VSSHNSVGINPPVAIWLVVSGVRLEIVEPGHDIIFVLPIDQFIYFRILRDGRLDILDKAVLDVFSLDKSSCR